MEKRTTGLNGRGENRTPTHNLTSRKTILNCFARQSPLERGSVAFTLAEVLITLGIIGAVASMTMPTLIQKQQEKAKVTALKKFYSTISQAYQFAVMEHGTPDLWGLSLGNSENMLKYLQPQMKFIKFCRAGEKCHPLNNLYLRNGNLVSNAVSFNPSDNSRFAAVLADGMIVGTFVQSPECKAVYASGKHLENICGEYMVDVNGAKNPNKYGDDIFIFNLTKYGIVPNGAQIYENNTVQIEDGASVRFNPKNYRFDTGCLAANAAGWGCTGWVLEYGNMDYFRCNDLAWGTKTKCK